MESKNISLSSCEICIQGLKANVQTKKKGDIDCLQVAKEVTESSIFHHSPLYVEHILREAGLEYEIGLKLLR